MVKWKMKDYMTKLLKIFILGSSIGLIWAGSNWKIALGVYLIMCLLKWEDF